MSLSHFSPFISIKEASFSPHNNYLPIFADMLIILSLQEQRANQQCDHEDMGPLMLNAFDLIILSQGLNLAAIFDRGQVLFMLSCSVRGSMIK